MSYNGYGDNSRAAKNKNSKINNEKLVRERTHDYIRTNSRVHYIDNWMVIVIDYSLRKNKTLENNCYYLAVNMKSRI